MNFKKGFNLAQIISIFLIFIGIIILIFVATKIGLIRVPGLGKKETSSKQQSINPENKYCVYAKETLKWLDSKRDDNGKYLASVNCDLEEKTCNFPQPAGQSGHDAISAIWARYKYIQKTGDKDEIAILKKDIDYYYKQLELMQVQNIYWNCKLLLEINDQKILDQGYLDKVHKLCNTSTYKNSDEVKYYYDEKTDSNVKVISSVDYYDWQNPDKAKDLILKTDKFINRDYRWYVYFPGDFVALYKSTKNENNLDIANAYFNKLLQAYYIDNTSFSPNDKCLLAISSLDLYSVNQDQKYLDWAKNVHALYFLNEGVKSEGMTIECAYLNRELAKYDNNPKYKADEEKLLTVFTSKYLDGGESFRKLSGEGGFFLIEESNILTKDLRQNALMVNLLCP